MYLHLGQDFLVDDKNLIGIFDIDNASVKKDTRDYLTAAQKNNEIVSIGYDIPLTFAVCYSKQEKKQTVSLSPVSTATLKNRTKK